MYCKKDTIAGRQREITYYAAPMQEVITEIVFGTPSKNCEGVGLCRMLSPVFLKSKQIYCPHATAYFAMDKVRGIYSLRFPKSFLSRQMVARHFYKGLFKVTEPYRVPAHISRALGLQQILTIREGGYVVKETPADWIVVFDNGHT